MMIDRDIKLYCRVIELISFLFILSIKKACRLLAPRLWNEPSLRCDINDGNASKFENDKLSSKETMTDANVPLPNEASMKE